MVISCGMAVKRMEMLGVSVGKMKALTVKKETVTLTDKGRENLTCRIQCVKLIAEHFFLADVLFLVEMLRKLSPWSCLKIRMQDKIIT
jgi:hypothetical protein